VTPHEGQRRTVFSYVSPAIGARSSRKNCARVADGTISTTRFSDSRSSSSGVNRGICEKVCGGF